MSIRTPTTNLSLERDPIGSYAQGCRKVLRSGRVNPTKPKNFFKFSKIRYAIKKHQMKGKGMCITENIIKKEKYSPWSGACSQKFETDL